MGPPPSHPDAHKIYGGHLPIPTPTGSMDVLEVHSRASGVSAAPDAHRIYGSPGGCGVELQGTCQSRRPQNVWTRFSSEDHSRSSRVSAEHDAHRIYGGSGGGAEPPKGPHMAPQLSLFWRPWRAWRKHRDTSKSLQIVSYQPPYPSPSSTHPHQAHPPRAH